MKIFLGINKQILLYLLWFIPVLYFLIVGEVNTICGFIVWFIAFISIVLTFNRNASYAIIFPYLALLSPLAVQIKIFNLIPSEIFLLILIYKQFYYLIKKNFSIKKNISLEKLIFIIPIIFFILFSDYYYQYKSFLNIIFIISVYSFTSRVLKSYQDIQFFLSNLLVASSYMVLLIIYGYTVNMEMYRIFDENSITFFTINDDILIRASYFYTNFFYIVGIATLIIILNIIYLKEFIFYLLLILLIYCNYIVYNKTTIVSLFISIFIILLFNRLYKLITFMVIIFLISINYINDNSFYSLNTGSISARLTVFSNLLSYYIFNPMKLLTGNGPDSIIRGSNPGFGDVLWGGYGEEGAIDSTYLSYLFDYGIIFLVAYLYFICKQLSAMLFIFRNSILTEERNLSILLFSIIIFIAITGLTQSLGTNKIVMIVAQIFALSHVLRKYVTLKIGVR